ncbi:MAG: hemolysin family protein [Candidatus Acidiferrales bacterium]
MPLALYTLGVIVLTAGLLVFSYLDRVFRELGRVSTGRIHDHLEVFEAEIEPRFKLERRRANLVFSLLSRLWLVLVAVATARGVLFFVPEVGQSLAELIFFLGAEVVLAMQLLPHLLLARTSGRWLIPLVPVIRVFVWIAWPVHALLGFFISVLHISEEEEGGKAEAEQQALEDFVEAATEEGIIEQDEARLIEQVVEFSDKRVREVMTPRPDVVGISADANLEELRRLLVEKKFSRLPVFESSLDQIIGIVVARDILEVPERDAAHRKVRELVRPALFVPETKFGSELLKEMQRKNQQLAVVVDEYGSTAGIVTTEDLVEEIVGEIGEEDRAPSPDVVREAGSGDMILRGSVSLEKIQELFGVELQDTPQESGATTVAGLLNSVAGHVPAAGEVIDFDGLRFEVLEANQRKVLRLRARRRPESQAAAAPSA